jgi:hypothetical protein
VDVVNGREVAVTFRGFEGAGQGFGGEGSGDDENGFLTCGDKSANPSLFLGVVGGGRVREVLSKSGFWLRAFSDVTHGAVVGVDEVVNVEHLEGQFDCALVGVRNGGVASVFAELDGVSESAAEKERVGFFGFQRSVGGLATWSKKG